MAQCDTTAAPCLQPNVETTRVPTKLLKGVFRVEKENPYGFGSPVERRPGTGVLAAVLRQRLLQHDLIRDALALELQVKVRGALGR